MASLLQPGQQIDRYEVVRLLGKGGMAEVYLVRHRTLQTEHALKLLMLSGVGLGQRMVVEGQIQARIDHVNVVRVQDVLEIGGVPALLMEFVDGPDLALWIHETAPGPALAAKIFRGIVEGVSAAHQAGVIHRDLKPSNVLLAKMPDGRLVPKVTDFGLVKVLQPSEPGQTRSGIPLGTPQYMAPEQIRDASRVDVRADVFSLGCILYELLTGVQCYPGADLIEIFEKIDRGQRKPLPDRVPQSLRTIIDRCLAKDPAARPQSTAALLALLDRPEPYMPAQTSQRVPARAPKQVSAPMIAVSVIGSMLVVLVLTVLVLFVAMSQQGTDEPISQPSEPGPCVTGPGIRGVVRVPGVFERRVGSSYIVREQTAVREEPSGAVTCTLAPGAQIEVIAQPTRIGMDNWLLVDGSKLFYGPADAQQPSSGEIVAELCVGVAGEVLGWAHIAIKLGQASPVSGRTWTLSRTEQVRTGQSTGDVVCALPAGTEIDVDEMRTGRKPAPTQFWVRISDNFRLD